MLESVIRITIVWQENKKGPGVMSYHQGAIVFPGRIGFDPPTGGATRERYPKVDDTEDCVLELKGTTYFAYPVATIAGVNDLRVEENHGRYFVVSDNGTLEVEVTPNWDCKTVTAFEQPDGSIRITVIPDQD